MGLEPFFSRELVLQDSQSSRLFFYVMPNRKNHHHNKKALTLLKVREYFFYN